MSLDLSNNYFDSSIPDKFLAGVADTSSPILVNLVNNHITGGISSSIVVQFKKLTLYITGTSSQAYLRINAVKGNEQRGRWFVWM